jgi:hypothetical protein
MLLFVREWSAVGGCGNFGFSSSESEVGKPFLLIIFQRKKEKKESRRERGGFKWSKVFLEKYYLTFVLEGQLHSITTGELLKVKVEIFSKTRRARTLLFETGS